MRAISYLRTAELENCVCGTTADSCLFPIQGGGIHRRPEGSRHAIAELVERLKEKPNDLGAMWLLNLAVQTLGETPPEVRPEWVIPKSVFESERDIGRFRDVARKGVWTSSGSLAAARSPISMETISSTSSCPASASRADPLLPQPGRWQVRGSNDRRRT
jgi:hypothetical protein